jgi:hypothetical protein
MPLGSSSAAPVTSPGPKTFRTFRSKEYRLPLPALPVVTDFIVGRFAAATLVARLSLGPFDCFFRAK